MLAAFVLFFMSTDVNAQSASREIQDTLASEQKGLTPVADSGYVIRGVILDERKQPLIGALVQLRLGGIAIAGAATDLDGNYVIRRIAKGTYDLVVTNYGYEKYTLEKLRVDQPGENVPNILMQPSSTDKYEVIQIICPPILAPPGRMIFRGYDIKHMPIR